MCKEDMCHTTPDLQDGQGTDRTDAGQEQNSLQLEAIRAQVHEWQQKFFYVSADFENYKKRMLADRTLHVQTAQAELIRKLLPVVDSIERALGSLPAGQSDTMASWLEGLRMMYQSFQDFLRASGIEEINTSGQFDPEIHEALSHVASSEHTPGQIVQVLQKGYSFKGTVLRPALVSVAQ